MPLPRCYYLRAGKKGRAMFRSKADAMRVADKGQLGVWGFLFGASSAAFRCESCSHWHLKKSL